MGQGHLNFVDTEVVSVFLQAHRVPLWGGGGSIFYCFNHLVVYY